MGDIFEEVLAELDPTGKWETDGFGLDSNLRHCESLIEQDAKACPECGAANPLLGII
jgi:hypothetical protein